MVVESTDMFFFFFFFQEKGYGIIGDLFFAGRWICGWWGSVSGRPTSSLKCTL